MKRFLPLFFLLVVSQPVLWGSGLPDFVVGDIIAKSDGFIHIKLENRSPYDCPLKPALDEKIFLTLYIDGLKRAEYKLKYIDKKLFKRNGVVFFRTNFRAQANLKIKVDVNKAKIFSEANFLNNTLQKQL